MGTRHLAQYKAKLSGNGLEVPYQFAGAPVNNSTMLGRAVVGSVLIDTTAGFIISVRLLTEPARLYGQRPEPKFEP